MDNLHIPNGCKNISDDFLRTGNIERVRKIIEESYFQAVAISSFEDLQGNLARLSLEKQRLYLDNVFRIADEYRKHLLEKIENLGTDEERYKELRRAAWAPFLTIQTFVARQHRFMDSMMAQTSSENFSNESDLEKLSRAFIELGLVQIDKETEQLRFNEGYSQAAIGKFAQIITKSGKLRESAYTLIPANFFDYKGNQIPINLSSIVYREKRDWVTSKAKEIVEKL